VRQNQEDNLQMNFSFQKNYRFKIPFSKRD